jgi:RNA polymerase-binding transcription factor
VPSSPVTPSENPFARRYRHTSESLANSRSIARNVEIHRGSVGDTNRTRFLRTRCAPTRSPGVKRQTWITMDVERYKQQLLALEKTLSNRTAREVTLGRDQFLDTASDAGDASVADESESEDFTEAELDATILKQVRDALQRIRNGTYGQCLIDGGPIESKRLDAMPWTPYCLKHQNLLEEASRPKPTL